MEWGNWAAGQDPLANENWQSHRWVVKNRYVDHRVYRGLTDYALAGMERLLHGHETDPTPTRLFF
ncbi:hypothetical protein DFAR_2920003 [Desulfarculales bacterium]